MGLVAKIKQRFPFAEATVEKLTRGKAVLSAGSRDGIRTGMRFLVVSREDAEDEFAQSFVRLVDGKTIQLTAGQVKEHRALADIEPAPGRDTLGVGDYVYTR